MVGRRVSDNGTAATSNRDDSAVGLLPTAFAWMPNHLYLGSSNGELAMIDTAAALKHRQQAQQVRHRSRFGSLAASAANTPASPSQAAVCAVVAKLEFGGQEVHIEALAVNKDCVAVAGQCPIIRQGIDKQSCCMCSSSLQLTLISFMTLTVVPKLNALRELERIALHCMSWDAFHCKH